MYSVTQRIQSVKQPHGGYLPVKNFEVIHLKVNKELIDGESIAPQLVGIVVDYLTRFMSGTSAEEAFKISLAGASIVKETKGAIKLAKNIHGLDDTSIISSCKLAGYDSAFRAGVAAYKDVNTINPSAADIENIREMVERSLAFFEEYGPVVKDGITFEGGYTDIVSSGDGDFITGDTLWDFKVSVNKPTSKHTLQLLMYYIMGLHSIHSNDYKNIKYLAIYNPRLNSIYRFPISEIPNEIITKVSDEVIGYSLPQRVSNDEDTILSVKDVAYRYGVGENKIRKDCFALGMPHYKQGNKYVINELDLIDWEVRQVYIPVGRNEKRLLPGYLALIGLLTQELNEAKKSGDKNRVKELKMQLRKQKKRNPNNNSEIAVAGILVFVLVVIVLFFTMASVI